MKKAVAKGIIMKWEGGERVMEGKEREKRLRNYVGVM